MSSSDNQNSKNPLEVLSEQLNKIEVINRKLLHSYKEELPVIVNNFENILIQFNNALNSQIDDVETILNEKLQKASNVELNISKEGLQAINNLEKRLSFLRKLSFGFILGLIISLAITFVSGHYAQLYYKESIMTKREVRDAVLDQIHKNGDVIIKKDYVQALKTEKFIISHFMKYDEKSAESYKKYRKAFLDGAQKAPVFKSVISDEILK